MNRIFKFFSSLWLTVVLLAFALFLVFFGTLAQVKLGLYTVQAEYFRSFFVWWGPAGAGWKIPIFPGGWFLGTLLLINLLAAHIKRFRFTWKKSGIFLTHAGLVLLLLGQFFTEVYQIESTLRLSEGEARNFTEDSRRNELAIIDTSLNAESNRVVSIPERMIHTAGALTVPELPFTIRVKNFAANSRPTGPMADDSNVIKSRDGIGKRLNFVSVPTTAVMDDENKPAALVEVAAGNEVIGEFLVTTWLTRYPWPDALQQMLGGTMGGELTKPQTFTHNGHTYEIALRPTRYYKPYEITLLDFSHDKYKGTDIPKNFSSKVHLKDPSRGEERDVLIYMNNPLRYAGETFFQSGFLPDDSGTILQVVKNPAAPTPYISCTLVALGLVIQFLIHLFDFIRSGGRSSRNSGDGSRSASKTSGDRVNPNGKLSEAVATPRKIS